MPSKHRSCGAFDSGVRPRQHGMGNEKHYPRMDLTPAKPTGQSRASAPRYAAGPFTGDRQQAEYFVALLNLNLQRIDHRIEKCRAAITFSQAAGDIENVIGFRDLLRLEQQERLAVQGLIANLQRRFAPGTDHTS